MYRPVIDAVSGSLALTALVAMLPLLTLFVLLGVLRMAAWKAALVSLAVSLVVAIVAYSMPVGQASMAGIEGAVFGFFPILWIVINAIWVYNMTVVTGHFDVLRRSLAKVSGLPEHHLSQIVGRQTPLLAVFVPMALVFIIDGWRGVRATLPATLTVGFTFAIAQFACSNFVSTQLTDIVASLVAAASVMLLLRVCRPAGSYVEALEVGTDVRATGVSHSSRGVSKPGRAGAEVDEEVRESGYPIGMVTAATAAELAERDRQHHDSGSDVFKAYAPYLIIIVVFSLAQIPVIKDALAAPTR